MESLKFLLERYKNGIATTAQKKALLDRLSVDESPLHKWLQTEFDEALRSDEKLLSDAKSKEIFEKILKKKSQGAEKKIHHLGNKKLYRWVAAASMGGVAFWSLNVFTGKKIQQKNVFATATVEHKKTISLKRIVNNGNVVITSVLEDGTKVLLSPKSAIVYNDFAHAAIRAVELDGQARFSVKHDKIHPFSVKAKGIVVTDLGTVFSVNSFSNKVKVRLFKGKVMIHSLRKDLALKDTYLKPGELFSFSVTDGKFAVSDFRTRYIESPVAKDKIVPKPPVEPFVPDSVDKLVFNQTSLPEVFAEMGKMYNRHINYNIKEIKTMSFSGTINRTDSLQTMLEIICTTNDLNFKDSVGNIFIHK